MKNPSSNPENYRVHDLFSPNDWFDCTPAERRDAGSTAAHPHVNPAAAHDSFVFTNPLFAPTKPRP